MLHKFEKLKNIYYVESFIDNFNNVTSEKLGVPPDGRYEKWLRRSLFTLDNLGVKANGLQTFEKLKNCEFYSMRYPKSKINPRIIYYIIGNAIILLYVFKEKSSADYDRAIEKCKNILKKMNT